MQLDSADLDLLCFLISFQKSLVSEYTTIKTQTNNMETYSRRDNLIFHGIVEPTNESSVSCTKSVRKLMVDKLQLSENAAAGVQFVRCHRINESKRASTCKPIIVRFKNYNDRELIWSKKTLITDRNCNVSEDCPREIAYRRRKLFPVFSKARKTPGINKKSISLKADILITFRIKYHNLFNFIVNIKLFKLSLPNMQCVSIDHIYLLLFL